MNQAIVPPTLGQRVNGWLTDTAAFKWVDSKVTPASDKIKATKASVASAVDTVGTLGSGIAANAGAGAKWGIIILFAILGLFLVAQMKSLTAAFKE